VTEKEIHSGRCADCVSLKKCMTEQFVNTPVGNMNEERWCAGFKKVEDGTKEVVEFT